MGSYFGKAAAVLTLLSWTPAHGATLLANGDFAGSITGWQQIGTVFNTGESAVLSDSVSLRTVIFQTAVVPDDVILLRLSFDLLTALAAPGLGQTPDSVFITAFLGTQPFGVNFEVGLFDPPAIGILDADFSGFANLAGGLTSGPSPKGTGWTRFSMNLPTAPFATVAFEFIDGNLIHGDSTAAVDNVVLEPEFIPEPSAGAVLLAYGLLLMRVRHRS